MIYCECEIADQGLKRTWTAIIFEFELRLIYHLLFKKPTVHDTFHT